MQICNWVEINSLAVKSVGKHAVYVSNGLEYEDTKDDEIWTFVCNEMKSIYGKDTSDFNSIMSNLISGGLFFFNTEEEQRRFYRVFEQPLTDSSAIYACTYGPNGECCTENT